MTQASENLRVGASAETRLVASVSAAHFVSHYYILLLAPLFAFVRADYGVSYTELGLALTAFNVVSAVLQTPAGFMVDRLGARPILIGGIIIGALAFAVAGSVNSFWVLVAMFALAGVGNTVYHPADYSLLSHHVAPARAAKAFSVHTFAGMLGSAVAPGSLLLMQSLWGWRGAFLGAAVLGIVVAAVLLLQGEEAPAIKPEPKPHKDDRPVGWRLLLSAPVLLNLAFFMLLALSAGGMQNYSVVAAGALHGTAPGPANAALSGYLLLSALGVLAGGTLATHTSRHGLVAAIGVLMVALLAALIAFVDLGSVVFILAMSIGGFFNGAIMPSRDMIVREVTPAGSFGKVFGFVTTGFNLGGIVSPLIFGAIMDNGAPQWVFLMVTIFSLLTILTVFGGQARR